MSTVLPPQVLCVDLGTSSMKVCLMDASGHLTGWASSEIAIHLIADNGAEQVPDGWWAALVACC